jgi:hypothetical protein
MTPRHPFAVGQQVETVEVIDGRMPRGRGRRASLMTWEKGARGVVVECHTFKWVGTRPGEPTHGHEVVVQMDDGSELIANAGVFRSWFPTLADYEAMRAAGTFPTSRTS